MAELVGPEVEPGDRAEEAIRDPPWRVATATFEELFCGRHDRAESPLLVDVRRAEEYLRGHLHGAVHVALPEVADRCRTLPDRQLWVYCRDGRRAMRAALVLDRAGHDVVALVDDYENAVGLGLLDPPASAN